ncbi:MAG: DNA-directed RNA polymerase subunit beta', partial [Candidatus Giovannonibacteria bacterium GW2011_GWA2_53_7]
TKPETINYRTQKPEKDGLFDERIFGPTKDWECYCGKYKRIRYKGIICDKCGVEVTRSIVRRERMAHIELACPVAHIWFLRSIPSKIGLMLDLGAQDLEKVTYFANFIITSVNEERRLQTIEQVKGELRGKRKNLENELAQVEQNSNAEAVTSVKQKITTLEQAADLALKELRELKPRQILSEQRYQDLSLKYGHVFEAGVGAEAIRQLLSEIDLHQGVIALEEELKTAPPPKQRRLIRRTKLLKALLRNRIRPEWTILTVLPVIPPDLRPMVQLDGGRFATSDLNDLYRRVINRNNRLKRLQELNAPEVIQRNEKRMLQEAVDALIDNNARHGKTVTAATGQKRMLKSIADMLKGKQGRFRQNLLGKRVDYSGRSVIVVGPKLKLYQCGLPKTMALELFKPFVISQLIKEEIVHNVRSGNRFIETGHPRVWAILEEVTKNAHVLLNRAPTLHRLGIQAFQPILIEGKAIQVHPLVCPAFNADFDGDQMAVHVPLTEEAKHEAATLMLSSNNLLKPATGEPVVIPNKDVIWGCYYLTNQKPLATDAKLKIFADAQEALAAYELGHISLQQPCVVRIADERLTTTPGRLIFNKIIPDELGFVNDLIKSKQIKKLVAQVMHRCGHQSAVDFLDDLKDLGFSVITRSGLSWSMSDLPVPPTKGAIMAKADKEVELIRSQYEEGLLTERERYLKTLEVWGQVKNDMQKAVQAQLDPQSSVFSMIDSGARGSLVQLTQIMGTKGQVVSPSGEIIELPIKASFQEGLDVLEYFISTHGARKGLTDTALKTANAGYLTRRLINVAQDMIILEEDCGDRDGIVITKPDSEVLNLELASRIVGRVILETVVDPTTGEDVVKANTLITDEIADRLRPLNLAQVRVRSNLSCRSVRGVCQRCYGTDLGRNKLQGLPRVEEIFECRPPKRTATLAKAAGFVSVTRLDPTKSRSPKVIRIQHTASHEEKFTLPAKDKGMLRAAHGSWVTTGQILWEGANGQENIVATADGRMNVGMRSMTLTTYVGTTEITEQQVASDYTVWVKDGDHVVAGQQLTEGSADLHELYSLTDPLTAQRYIINEIMFIYASQGQKTSTLNEPIRS